MASRAIAPAPLAMLLAALPSLPRPILSRLVAQMIDRMDDMDGDDDTEPDAEAEPTGWAESVDQRTLGRGYGGTLHHGAGSADDAEEADGDRDDAGDDLGTPSRGRRVRMGFHNERGAELDDSREPELFQ